MAIVDLCIGHPVHVNQDIEKNCLCFNSVSLSLTLFSPEPVESVLGAVDGEYGGPGVGLGDPPIPLQYDHLLPEQKHFLPEEIISFMS